MKKLYTLLSAVALTTAVNAQNLIENGNFENWTGENPVNFDKVGTSPIYNDLLFKETTISVSGNSVRQTSKAQGTTQYLEYGELIAVTAGHSYTISYSYLDNDTQARTRLWSSWLDATGTALATNLQNLQEADYSTDSSSWVNKTITVTAPAGATQLRYQIRAYHQDGASGGYIYYDNLSLVDNSVTGIATEDIAGLKLYPNPLALGATLNITSNNAADKAITIYDVLGKQVFTGSTVRDAVNTSDLKAGIYIVKITEGDKTATRKLIVQ